MTSTKAFRLGLIGHPVSHSKSPEIFRGKFDREGFSNASYELFDLPNLENFGAWINQYEWNIDSKHSTCRGKSNIPFIWWTTYHY